MSDAYSSDSAVSSISRTSSVRSSPMPSSSKSSSRASSGSSSRSSRSSALSSSIRSKEADKDVSLDSSHHDDTPNPPPKTHTTQQDSGQVVQRALRALKTNSSGSADLSSLSFSSDEMMAMCHILGSKRGVQFVDFTLSTFPSSSGALLLNAIKMNPTPIESVRLEGSPLPSKWKALIESQTASNTERALRRAAALEQATGAAADVAYRKAALEGSQHLLTFFKQSMKRLQVDEHNEWRVVMEAASQSLSVVQNTMHRQAVGSKFSVYFQVLTEREEVSRSAIEAMALQTSYSECLLAACREYERILFSMAMIESRHLWKRFGSSFTVAATHTRARLMERRVDGAEVYAEALAGRIPIVKSQIEERAVLTSTCNAERARVRQGDVEKVQREDERRRKIRHSLRDEGQAMDHSWMRRKFADEDGVLPTSHNSALIDSDAPNIAILREELFDHEIDIRKQLTAFEASVFKGVLQIRKYYDRLAGARRRVSELSGLYWSCLRETPMVMYRVSNTARECTLYERTSPFVAIEPEATLNVTVGALWPVRMSLLRNDLNKWLPQLRAARQDVGPLILALLLQIIKDYRLAGVGDAQWVADFKADVRDAPDYTAVEETLQVSVSDIQATKERLFIGEISYTLPPELKRIGRLGFGTPNIASNDIQFGTDLNPHAKMHHELLAASGQVLEVPKGPSLPLPHWGIRVAADGASLSITVPTGATQDAIEGHLRQVVFVPVWSSYYCAYSNQRHLKPGATDLLVPDTVSTSGRRRSLCSTRTGAMNSTTFLVESPIVAPIQMSMKLFTLKKRRFAVSMFSSDQNVGEQPEKTDGVPQLLRSYVSLAKGTPTKSNTPNKASTPLAKSGANQVVQARKKYCFPSCQLTERSVEVSIVVLPEPVSILTQRKTRHDAKSGLWHVVPPSTLRLHEPPSVKRGNTKVSLLPPIPSTTLHLPTIEAISAYLLAQNVAHNLEEGATSATDEFVSRPWYEAFTDPAASTPPHALPTKSVFNGLHIRVRFPQRSKVPMEDEVALVPSPNTIPQVVVDADGDSISMVPDWGCLAALQALMKEGCDEWLAAHSVRLRVASLSLVGGETSVAFVDEPYVTSSVVRGVLNALVYRNNSVDPTYGVRRVAVEITNPRFFVHHTANIELDVYAADDPPEMESGMPHMFTAPSVADGDVGLMAAADGVVSLASLKANLPSAHRDVFGSVRIVDDDTAFFDGGHLVMELREGAGTTLSTTMGIGLFIDVPSVGSEEAVGRTGLILQTDGPIREAVPQVAAPTEAWLNKMSEARALAGPKTKPQAPPSALSKVASVYEPLPSQCFPSLSMLMGLIKEGTSDSPPASPVAVAPPLPVVVPQVIPSFAKLFDDGVYIADLEFGEELGEQGMRAPRTLTNRIKVSFVGGCAATLDCVQELLRRVRFVRNDRPKRWLLQVGASELSVDDFTKFVAANPIDDALETVAALEFLPGPTAGRKDVEGKDVPGEASLEPLCAEVKISHTATPLVATSASVSPLVVTDPSGAALPFDGTLSFSEGLSLGGGYVRVEMVSGVEDGDQIHILPTRVPTVEVLRQPSSPTKKNYQPDPVDTHSAPICVDPGLYAVPVYRRNQTKMDPDTRQLLALHVFTKQFLTANDPLGASQSMGEGTILGERTMSLFHSLLISASANRRSRHYAHVGFDPMSSLDPGPPSLDAEIQWAMRCRKIHLFRAESGGSTEGHLGLVEKACHYLLEDHRDMLRRRGLGGFVGMSGDLCPFVAQVDDLFWVPTPVESTLGELAKLDPPGVLGRIYSVLGPTPSATLASTTTSKDVPDGIQADTDLAPPTVSGEAVLEGSQKEADIAIDPSFQLFSQDARELINEPHRLRGRSANHFARLQRSSHQCALIVSFREGVEVTSEMLSNLASRIAYSTTSTYPSVPRKVLKLTVCGGGLGGDMSSSVFRHMIVATPPPKCRITTANPTLTYRATVSELALLPPMAGSQRGKRNKSESQRVSSAIGQSRGSASVCSEKGFPISDSVQRYHQPSLPDRLVGTTPFPPLGALRLYPQESVHIDDGDGDVGLVDWGGSTIELTASGGMSILDCLVVLPEEQQRLADERVYQFAHQRVSAVRDAQSRAKEGKDAGSTKRGGRGRRGTTSAADSSVRQIEPFDTVGSSLFRHLSRTAAQTSADSDSDGLSDSPKPDPSVWDSWVVGGVKHWTDVENRLIAPALPYSHSGASTASGTPATGSLPAGTDVLSHATRLYVRVEPPFELGAYPIVYGDPLIANGRDGTFTTNEVDNAEWSVVRAIQQNFSAVETEGGVDGIIQYYSSTSSSGGKSSLPTSRRGSTWSVSAIREHPLSESSTRTFHFVDEHGMMVMADAGTITLSRTIPPPPKGEKPKSFKVLPGKAKPTKGIALSAATPALPTEDLKLTISISEQGHITSNHLQRLLGSIGLFSHDPLKWQQSQYATHDDRHSPKKSDGLTPDLLLHPSRMCITKKLSGFLKHRSGDVHEVPTISVRCEPPPITKQSGKTAASPAVISLRDISEPPSCALFSLPATSGPKDVPLITWRGLTDRVTISCLDVFPVQGWCAERDSLQLRLSGSAFNLSPDGTVMCGREPIAKLTTSTPSFIRLEFDESANAPSSSKLDCTKSTTPDASRLAKGAPAPQGFEPTGAAGSATKQGASWGRVLLLLQCLHMAVDVKDGKDREVFPTEDRVICVQIVDPFAHRVSITSGTGCPQYEVSQLLQRVVFLRSGEKALF